jgi:methylglutaconyl-CoA hydratase
MPPLAAVDRRLPLDRHDAMTPTTLEVSVAHDVAVVWLDRADVRNAFNEVSVAELSTTFAALGASPAVRAIVLAGRGTAFCAGADLAWMQRMAAHSIEQNRADALTMATMLRIVAECPKPVIARVHGDAVAGGMGLVAACDIAVAATTAQFCLSETKLGLIPATIAPYVVRAIGASAARRYMLTAERFTAAEAYRIGLVHELAAPEALDETINELLGTLMLTSTGAVRATKRLIRDVDGAPIDDALIRDTAERIALVRASEEGREGVAAFLTRRKPRWVVEYEAMVAAAQDADPPPRDSDGDA